MRRKCRTGRGRRRVPEGRPRPERYPTCNERSEPAIGAGCLTAVVEGPPVAPPQSERRLRTRRRSSEGVGAPRDQYEGPPGRAATRVRSSCCWLRRDLRCRSLVRTHRRSTHRLDAHGQPAAAAPLCAARWCPPSPRPTGRCRSRFPVRLAATAGHPAFRAAVPTSSRTPNGRSVESSADRRQRRENMWPGIWRASLSGSWALRSQRCSTQSRRTGLDPPFAGRGSPWLATLTQSPLTSRCASGIRSSTGSQAQQSSSGMTATPRSTRTRSQHGTLYGSS